MDRATETSTTSPQIYSEPPFKATPEHGFEVRRVESQSTVNAPRLIFHRGLQLARAVEQAATMTCFRHLGIVTPIDAKDPLKDYAGQPLPCNFQLETDNPHEAAKLAIQHNLGIVFIGALTSATNNFGPKSQPENLKGVIAIKPKGLTNLEPTKPEEYLENKSNQIVINRHKLGPDNHTVTVGAGLTYSQVNEIVARELGPDYWVAVDITSIDSALAGAVFATGGQGPSGIKLSEIATRVNMTDGKKIHTLTNQKDLQDHEGLAGLQGGVTELEIKVLKRPPHRFGFRLALKNTAGHQDYSEKAAALLAKIAPYFKLKFENGVISSEAGADMVDGIEIMDLNSIKVVNATRHDPLSKRILHELQDANSDYCVYLTGNSAQTIQAMADSEDPNILLALAELEDIADIVPVEGHDKLEAMRVLREQIPDTVKRQVTHSKTKPFSTSLDFNFSIDKNANLDPEQLQEIYHEILRAFYEYEQCVTTFVGEIARAKDANIAMFRYGHLGRDPHTRFTIWSNETEPEAIIRPDDVQDVGRAISVFKKSLLKTLQGLQEKHPEIQIHAGEKGKIPEPEVLSAEVLALSKAIIAAAGPNWNFRSPL